MVRDIKKINNKNNNKIMKKKKDESSDDDNDSFYTDDNSSDEMDPQEYRKLLKELFPSKHIDKKVKAGKRVKKAIEEDLAYSEDDDEDEYEDDESYVPPSKTVRKTNKKPIKKQNKKSKIELDDDEDIDEELDDDYEDEDEELDDDEVIDKKRGNFNFILAIGGEDEDGDETWSTCSDISTENEDDPISTDEDEDEDKDDGDKYKKNNKKDKKDKKDKKKTKSDEKDINVDIKDDNKDKSEEIADDDFMKQLKDMLNKDPKNSKIKKMIEIYDKELKEETKKNEKKIKKEKARNSRIFKRIMRDKNTMNDFEFYDKMEISQQKKIIKELREINKIIRVEKPYRLTLLESDIPAIFKATAIKKINSLRYMDPGSGEFYKMKNWVDTFMRIPFNEYKSLPISLTDGVEKCHDFMENAKQILDNSVYGLNDAKMQIMQLLGQLITNPSAIGSTVAIHGPPGTGKTTLVKEGISKILNRPFAFIALGGATDSSFLEGHGYTYEGSTWGKIVQILIDSKCMNPVIYFDELDKISDTPKGEEIIGILTHLTDTTQNSQFHDKYFAEIDFDLSKCLFMFSYNDETKINPILKDRMYRIQTTGYNQKQKLTITNKHLLPKIREQVKFESEDIIIPEQTINYIVENYCNKEDGVRNLKRCLEIIHTKINLYRLMRPGTNLFEEDMSIKVAFPLTITKDIVDKLIKKPNNNPHINSLYI